MIKVEVQEITNNLDRIRVPLNSMERAEKETNPIYPYIGANNIMGYIDEYLFDEKILCVAEDGGSWGYQQTCAKIYNEKVWVNNHAHVLTAKDNLILEYLMYYLNYADLTLYINGATRGKLTKSSLNGIKIPLPPLDQQKKIAAILDAADAYRQKTKALIEKYDELTQSLFLDMFGDPVTNPKGWNTNELGEILEITSSKRIFKDEYVDEGIPFYRTKEIVELSKGKKISLELFISEKRYSDIKSKFDIPEKGDILLSAVGTIGIMWTVNTEDPFYFKDGNLVWLKSANLKDVDSTYLRMTLEHLIDYEKYKLAEGGAYNALTIAKLKEFKVLLAPYDLQNKFAERVQAIESQKAQAQASLSQAEDLFNSLLQRAFKGELV